MKYKDFDSYRTWFNRNFALSFDGKFKGLSFLASILNIELFAYKLYKRLHPGKYTKALGDVISISINHHKIKLYAR